MSSGIACREQTVPSISCFDFKKPMTRGRMTLLKERVQSGICARLNCESKILTLLSAIRSLPTLIISTRKVRSNELSIGMRNGGVTTTEVLLGTTIAVVEVVLDDGVVVEVVAGFGGF